MISAYFQLLDPYSSAYRDHIIEFFCLIVRHVYTAVGSVILIDASSKAASPGGVMQTPSSSYERHPVVDERIILCDSIIFQTLQMYISHLVVQIIGARRCGMIYRMKVSGNDRCAEDKASVLTIVKGLFTYADEHIRICIDITVGIEAIPAAIYLGPLGMDHPAA